jgi:ribosome-associated protein
LSETSLNTETLAEALADINEDSFELARAIVDYISDIKGESIVLMDMRGVTDITDYFVIASGSSDRQLRAIADKVSEGTRQNQKVKPFRVDGKSEGGWLLMDYGHVVVHIFALEARAFYDLEGFWKAAKVVLRMQ